MFTLRVEMRSTAEGAERAVVSRLHLVDLAGSERTKKSGAAGGRRWLLLLLLLCSCHLQLPAVPVVPGPSGVLPGCLCCCTCSLPAVHVPGVCHGLLGAGRCW